MKLLQPPYESEVRCRVCNPSDQPEPPLLMVRNHGSKSGNVVERTLICPNCDAREVDHKDLVSGVVSWASYRNDGQAKRF
jgi:hypothetical protein